MRRTPTEILTFREAAVPDDLRLQVLALQHAAWPGDEPVSLRLVHDPELRPISMLLVEDGEVVSALDILSKEIVHRGSRYAASGLSTVVTAESRRRRGYGMRLVVAAREAMATSGVDLAIFTCDRPLQPFYERSGFRTLVDAPLEGGTPERPFPSDRLDKVTLAAFFSERAIRSAGGFEHTRIPLYPGEIDRLW